MDKEAFLQTVRRALGRDDGGPAPEYPPLQRSLEQQQEEVNGMRARVEAHRAELVERFLDMAQKGGWQVTRVETPEEAVRHVVRLAQESQARSVVRSDQAVFREVAVDGALEGVGVSVATMALEYGDARESLRQAAIQADLGITGVEYAIAETGTCVVVPRKGLSRLVSLAPPVHLAIVEASQVVESLDDLFALRRLEFLQNGGDMGSYMNFITGPSRTGDIEQTIVIGVHGPKEAHLVLIG